MDKFTDAEINEAVQSSVVLPISILELPSQ